MQMHVRHPLIAKHTLRQ